MVKTLTKWLWTNVKPKAIQVFHSFPPWLAAKVEFQVPSWPFWCSDGGPSHGPHDASGDAMIGAPGRVRSSLLGAWWMAYELGKTVGKTEHLGKTRGLRPMSWIFPRYFHIYVKLLEADFLHQPFSGRFCWMIFGHGGLYTFVRSRVGMVC